MIKILLVSLIFSQTASAVEPDKMKHFVLSAMISSASYVAYKETKASSPQVAAFLTVMAIGVAKEISDDKFDKRDLLCDGLGAITPLLLTWEF